MEPFTITVGLPTMNEELNVGPLCDKLKSFKERQSELFKGRAVLEEAIFVLNNTTDDTEKVLDSIRSKRGYKFVKISRSGGYRGSAIRRAADLAQGNVFVMMDSDGQYNPCNIREVVTPVIEGRYKMVIARDWQVGEPWRNMVSLVYEEMTRLLLGLYTVQGGLKAMLTEDGRDTIPKDVPGLDIDVEWANRVKEVFGCDAISYVRVPAYPREEGRTKVNVVGLSLGLAYTTARLAIKEWTGRDMPFPEKLKELTLRPRR
ncbi:glycosyltransferase family 2 protein [Candidatus Woesearchaeota archaeon]|nr:glycosyltransferase family 2 protein [Candidatus Woesearchaeota archaeon]